MHPQTSAMIFILLSIPFNKLFIMIEVCVEQSIHYYLFSTSNVLLRRETVVTYINMYVP